MRKSVSGPNNPFAGRWNSDIETAQDTYPGWMAVTGDVAKLKVRYQPRGGAVRPAVAAAIEGSHLNVTLAAATDKQPAIAWDVIADGDKPGGTLKRMAVCITATSRSNRLNGSPSCAG